MEQRKEDVTISHVVDIYNHGMEAYKFAQELFEKIDGKIHGEFVYATRSLVLLIDSKEKNGRYDQTAFNDTFQASRHILNDSVDLMVSYAALKIEELNSITRYSSVLDVYKDFSAIPPILKKFKLLIAETRKIRGAYRIDKYIEIIQSDDFKTLSNFCLSIEDIRASLKKKRGEEVVKAMQWVAGITVASIAAIAAIFRYIGTP